MSNKRPQAIFTKPRTDIIIDQKSLPPQEQGSGDVDDADDGSARQAAQPVVTAEPTEVVVAVQSTDDVITAEVTQPVQESVKAQTPDVGWEEIPARPDPINPAQWKKAMKPITTTLVTYAETMNPAKVITDETGGRAQYSLYRMIRDTLSITDYDVFKARWTEILSQMNADKSGVFNENVVFRYVGSFPGGELDFSVYRRVMWVMLTSMDPQSRRSVMSTVNMEVAMTGLTPVERENLINFYG